jgi:hypothetical protein
VPCQDSTSPMVSVNSKMIIQFWDLLILVPCDSLKVIYKTYTVIGTLPRWSNSPQDFRACVFIVKGGGTGASSSHRMHTNSYLITIELQVESSGHHRTQGKRMSSKDHLPQSRTPPSPCQSSHPPPRTSYPTHPSQAKFHNTVMRSRYRAQIRGQQLAYCFSALPKVYLYLLLLQAHRDVARDVGRSLGWRQILYLTSVVLLLPPRSRTRTSWWALQSSVWKVDPRYPMRLPVGGSARTLTHATKVRRKIEAYGRAQPECTFACPQTQSRLFWRSELRARELRLVKG